MHHYLRSGQFTGGLHDGAVAENTSGPWLNYGLGEGMFVFVLSAAYWLNGVECTSR